MDERSLNGYTSPVLLVEEALEISRQASPHSRLFALLDLDGINGHGQDRSRQIHQALEMARHHHLPNNRIFRLILTDPGFLFWLLLHFDEVDFSSLSGKEWQRQVVKKLAGFIANPNHAATRKKFFAKCRPHLEKAVKRSQKRFLLQSIQPGPHSEIHELIAYLRKLQVRYGS
jgi:hypothetical protein